MGSGFRHLRYKKREDDSISRTNDRLAASVLDMKKVSLVVQQEKHWIKRERRGDSVSRLSPCAGFPTLGNLPPGRKVPSEAGDQPARQPIIAARSVGISVFCLHGSQKVDITDSKLKVAGKPRRLTRFVSVPRVAGLCFPGLPSQAPPL